MFALPQYLTSRSCGVNLHSQKCSTSTWVSTVLEHTTNIFGRDLRAHFGCVNAIEFSNNGGKWIASGGDDRRILLWNVETNVIGGIGKPTSMNGEHHSNIFCIAFDENNKKILSGGNDEQVLVHDIATGELLDVFLHEDAVYGLSVDPFNDNIFASASDDGRIVVYDMRAPATEEPFVLAQSRTPMHAVHHNPVDSHLLATANSEDGIALWDIRVPKLPLLKYGGLRSNDSCMSVRFNQLGDHLLALRRRLPPVLYGLESANCVCIFEQTGYFNSCTMKSCSFVGDRDQYIISGSDDFNLYLWKVPSLAVSESTCCQTVPSAHLILKGHRSIVNQVRYSKWSNIIISSGVEKIIKVWSPFCIPGFQDRMMGGERQLTSISRPAFLRDDYIEMMIRGNDSPAMMTHDYTHESTEEDPRMIAFFDSLIRREREDFATNDTIDDDDDDDSDIGTQYLRFTDSEHSASNSGNEDDYSHDGGRASLTLSRSEWTESRSEVAEDPNTETVILLGRRVANRSNEQQLNGQLEFRVGNGRYSSPSSDDSSSSSSSSSSDSSHDTTVSTDRGRRAQSPTSNSNLELTVNGCLASTSTSVGVNNNIDTSESEQQSLRSLDRLRQLRKRVLRDDYDEYNLLPNKTCRVLSSNIEDRRTLSSSQTNCQIADRDNCMNSSTKDSQMANGDNGASCSAKVDEDTYTAVDTVSCDKHCAAICQRTVSNDLSESLPCCDVTEYSETSVGSSAAVVNNVTTNGDSDSRLTMSAGNENFNNQSMESSLSPRIVDVVQLKPINGRRYRRSTADDNDCDE